MEQENYLAESLDLIDLEREYDASCKRLLSEKQILARIMKYCVAEFADTDVETIARECIIGEPSVAATTVHPDSENMSSTAISGNNTEDKTVREGAVFYDIRFRARTVADGKEIQLIINLEAQKDYYPGYRLLKRAVYYGARLISAQYGKEFVKSDYDNLKKVYSIWICTSVPVNHRNTITRYRLTEDNLVGSVQENTADYDLITIIMVCLAPQADENNYLLGLLGTLLSQSLAAEAKKAALSDNYGIRMTEHFDEEVEHMCNLSYGVFEKGIEKGVEKGVFEGVLLSVKNLMESLAISPIEAMEKLKIPAADRPRYLAAL